MDLNSHFIKKFLDIPVPVKKYSWSTQKKNKNSRGALWTPSKSTIANFNSIEFWIMANKHLEKFWTFRILK